MNICFKSNNIIILALKLFSLYLFFSFSSLFLPFSNRQSDRSMFCPNSLNNYTCHYKDAGSKRQLTFSAGNLSAFEAFYVDIYLFWCGFSPAQPFINLIFIVYGCRPTSSTASSMWSGWLLLNL